MSAAAEREEKGRKRALGRAERTAGFPIWPFQWLMVGCDWFLSSYCFLIAYRLRALRHWPGASEVFLTLNPIGAIAIAGANDFRPYSHLFLILPVLSVAAFRYQRLYDLKGEFSFIDDFVKVFKATALASLGIIVIAFMYRGIFEFREFSYSRGVFLLDWLAALIAFEASRVIVRSIQILLRRKSRNLIRSVIVGDGPLAELCIAEIATRPRLGYRLLGTVARESTKRTGSLPVLGTLDELPEVLCAHDIEQVFITDQSIAPGRLFESIMRVWRDRPVEFSLVPQLLDSLPSKTDIDQIGSLPMVKLFQEPLRGPNRLIKRSIDVLVAGLILILLSPLLTLLYVLVRLESRGPAIFSQERVGMDGRVFRAHKFRTMHAGTDEGTHSVLMTRAIKGDHDATGDGRLFGKVPNDARVTGLGKWLRRASLDELPQFYNVLKGEMSVVGPRPPIEYEVEHYSAWQRKRLDVKPGITGLWQVSGRNRLPFEKMIEIDVYYIEHWSLWLDLVIMLKTLPAVFRRETA